MTTNACIGWVRLGERCTNQNANGVLIGLSKN